MTKTIELGKLNIDLNNDWEQIVGKWNWISFNLLKFYVEKENQFGMFEIEVYLLGFGIRFYCTWNKERLNKKVKEYKNIIDNGEFKRLEDINLEED